jgi:hypothetical protein
MDFIQPPVPLSRENDRPRLVGFEFEFTGLDLPRAVRVIQAVCGGEKTEHNRFQYSVETDLGRFDVKVDADIIRTKKYEGYFRKLGIPLEKSEVRLGLEEVVEKVSATVIPNEIVTPPIPVTRLETVNELSRKLRLAGAKGSKASILNAFGLHINPESPSLDVHTLRRHLQAFFLLQDWIIEESQIDVSRKMTRFIDDFPEPYVRRVLDPDYDPDMDGLIRDYLEHNPTRNRSLDMLPLFAWIDRDRVLGAVPEQNNLISPRPTFHYRLPNCLVDDPQWSPAEEWYRWVQVERLAADPGRLREMGSAWLALENTLFRRTAWIKQVRQWLHIEQ